MSFKFSCKQCGKQYRWNADIAGKRMKCPQCGTVVQIPQTAGMEGKGSPSPPGSVTAPASRSSAGSRAGSAADSAASPLTVRVTCPHCNASCRIQSDWRGRSIACPKCSKAFTAPLGDSGPKVAKPAHKPVPEFTAADLAEDGGYEVAEDEGAVNYEVVVEETPAAPEVPVAPVVLRKGRKRSPLGGAFGEWVRGDGLWILDAGGIAMMIVGTLVLSRGSAPGMDPALKVGFTIVVLGLLCVTVVVLPIFVAIGAVLLRVACYVGRVEAPDFLRCMGIVCLTACVQWLIGQIVGLVVGVAGPQQLTVAALITPLAINLAVGAAATISVLILTLEISLGRAALVWLIQLLLVIAIAAVFALFIFLILLALRPR